MLENRTKLRQISGYSGFIEDLDKFYR